MMYQLMPKQSLLRPGWCPGGGRFKLVDEPAHFLFVGVMLAQNKDIRLPLVGYHTPVHISLWHAYHLTVLPFIRCYVVQWAIFDSLSSRVPLSVQSLSHDGYTFGCYVSTSTASTVYFLQRCASCSYPTRRCRNRPILLCPADFNSNRCHRFLYVVVSSPIACSTPLCSIVSSKAARISVVISSTVVAPSMSLTWSPTWS